MNQREKWIAEFAAILGQELNGKMSAEGLASFCMELCRLGRRHHKLQERACNEEMPEGYDEKVEAKIAELCRPFGIVPVFGGDPRGCTVKLKVPSGRTNDWGGEGICVPQ